MKQRLYALAMAVVVCGTMATVATAQTNPIDGVWLGTYTSTHSPNPTPEVLIFKAVGTQVFGAYLSSSQSAATLVGQQYGNTYTFLVTQPFDGCEPATGTLNVTIANGNAQYAFAAMSCKGNDTGQGTAKQSNGAQAVTALKANANATLSGIWNGVYTSTYSTKPTKEKFFFASFGTTTKGIYVSDGGAAGILTGQITSNSFALSDYDPTPACPGRAVFQANKTATSMGYAFYSTDCNGQIDIGNGQAVPEP